MTLEELETFVAITRLQSFTEASRQLGRSQPAVSRRVRQLEESVGARLFERAGRRVVLTDAARALLPHAEIALAAVRDGERAVRERTHSGTATLRLAIVGTLADAHLVAALRAFEAQFPDTRVELRTATSAEVSGLVRASEADLGLRYFPDAHPSLESIDLGREQLLVIVRASHPLRQRRLRSLERLKDERWLGFAAERGQPDSFGRLLERTLATIGVAAPRYTVVDSLTAQKRLVEAGLGVALMPESSVREELKLGSLRAIQIQGLRLEQPVVVVRRRRGFETALASTFIELLREHTPDLRRRQSTP